MKITCLSQRMLECTVRMSVSHTVLLYIHTDVGSDVTEQNHCSEPQALWLDDVPGPGS